MKRFASLALASLAAVSLAAACPPPTPNPTPPGPTGGAPPNPPPVAGAAGQGGEGPTECAAPADDCARAGCNLWRRQCRDELGNPMWVGPTGASYAEGCRRAEVLGHYWGQACLATVTSCNPVVIAAARRAPKGQPCP